MSARVTIVSGPESALWRRAGALMWLLALLILAGPVLASTASQAVDVREPSTRSLGLSAQWLPEKTAPLTLAQARQQWAEGAFRPGHDAVMSFGIGCVPIWLHLTLNNPTDAPLARQLLTGATWTDDIEAYLVNPDGAIIYWHSGDAVDGAPGLVAALGFATDLDIPAGRSDLFIRYATDDPMVLPITLTDRHQLQQLRLLKTFLYGLIYGFVLALCAYNLMLYVGLRERSFLYYAIYLVSLLVCNVAYTGHGQMVLWSSLPGLQRYIILLTMVLLCAFGLLFAVRFLNLTGRSPRTVIRIRIFLWLSLGAMGYCILTGQQSLAAYCAFWVVTLFSVIMIGLALRYYRVHEAGRYFLAAALCSGSGALITALTVWGRIPFTLLGYHAFEWGVVLEATLLALALAQQMRHIQRRTELATHQANHDALTGVFNRRGFLHAAKAPWSTAERRNRPLSLLLLDIDHFKAVNDQFGHAIGDEALAAVAQLLCRQSREGDLVGRWGGEEFVVLLPETSLSEAAIYADRLREAVAALAPGSTGGPQLTVSLGVAEREKGHPVAHTIDAADRWLYLAKNSGRNQVCSAATATPRAS